MIFRDELKKKVAALFLNTEQKSISHQIADERMVMHYWSKELKEICHTPFQHHVITNDNSKQAPFYFYIMPSSALGNASSMTALRKQFIDSLCQEKSIDPETQNTHELYSACVIDHLYFVDISNRFVFYVINDFNQTKDINIAYRVSPFQYLFQLLMHGLNKQMTHSAAIANDDYGILLTGASGAGKTTTTLSALQHGYHYIGEDYTVLEKKDGQLFAHSIYNTVKMTEKTYQRIADFQEQRFISLPQRGKNAYFISEHNKFKIKLSAPIKAICSLSIATAKEPVLQQQTPLQAIKSLAFSTIENNPIFANQTLKKFHSFLENVALYHLTLGSDAKLNMQSINRVFLNHAA